MLHAERIRRGHQPGFERVIGVLHGATQRRAVKPPVETKQHESRLQLAKERQRTAERTDRVPDADELDVGRVRQRMLVVVVDEEFVTLADIAD